MLYDPDIAVAGANSSGYVYDTIGGQAVLRQVEIADGRPRNVDFIVDGLGQAIASDEKDGLASGDPHEIWYRMSGRQLGYVGNNGTLDVDYASSIARRVAAPGSGPFLNGANAEPGFADFDLAQDNINSYAQGSNAGMVVVQSGDTLASIAAALWGDDSLWYKIAEINGLTAESALVEGLPLIIPAGVQRNENNATTFKPYDPLEVLGNTAPTAVAKPKKHGCGAFGQILLAVIAIAVTVWTAGALSGASGAFANGAGFGGVVQGAIAGGSATLGGASLATATAVGAYAGRATALAAVGTSLSAFGAIAVGATAAAVGSIVSQGIGVMSGIQDKFSWNAVGLAAIGGGLGAGGKLGIGGEKWGSIAARSMVANAITQGIGVATGM